MILRVAAFVWLGISVSASACIVFSAPNIRLFPLTVGIRELSPWVAVVNLLGVAMAWKFHRGMALAFVACLLISIWPLAQIPSVVHSMKGQITYQMGEPLRRARSAPYVLLDSFRGIPSGDIEPQRLPLNILLYSPKTPGPWPVLIDIYGGAWQRGTPADDSRFNSYMASQGYAVFAIDYRHAPDAQFPAQIEDVRAAIAFVHENAARYNVIADRFALCGRSAGGQLALLAAYENGPVPILAVISFYGPTDLNLGYTDVPAPDPMDVRSVLTTYLGGPPGAVPERYHAASPVSYAGGKLPPTLLIQGGRDHIVKPVFARELNEKLRAAGNQSVLLEIPWAEHAFDAVFAGPGNQLALFYIERFLDGTLRDRM